MDEDSKTSLIIKSIVGLVVLIIIVVVAVIIINLSDGNHTTSGSPTTRRTVGGATVQVETSEKISKSTEETTESTEATTETTATTIKVTEATQAPVTNPPVTQAPYVPVTQTPYVPVTNPPVTQPVVTYTEISKGNRTSYSFALDNYEWAMVDKIRNTKNFKVASELRTTAERFASACCGSSMSCSDAVNSVDATNFLYQFTAYNATGLGYRGIDGYINWAYSELTKKYNVSNSTYTWVGVGIIQSQYSNSMMCVSVVFA